MRSQKTEIEDLIYPLKSIEANSKNAKNFQKDNYLKIQEIQKTIKDKTKTIEESEKKESPWKMEKFKKIQPRVSSKETLQKLNEIKQNEANIKQPNSNVKDEKVCDKITDSNLKKHNEEVKPKEANEKVEDLIATLPEPNVSVPSKEKIETTKEETKKKIEFKENRLKKPPVPKAKEIIKLAPRNQKDYLKNNLKKNIDSHPKPEKIEEKVDAHTLNPSYGKVPKYIESYKKKEEERKEIEKKEEEQKKLPPGTRLLSEEERVKTLENLKTSRDEVNKALNKMPIAIKTISMAKKKEELERKLIELDKAIDTFGRKNVFVALE